MKILVNSVLVEAPPGISLEMWLSRSEFGERRCAVALNEQFVPRGEHAAVTLSDGDRLEIVEPIQGG